EALITEVLAVLHRLEEQQIADAHPDIAVKVCELINNTAASAYSQAVIAAKQIDSYIATHANDPPETKPAALRQFLADFNTPLPTTSGIKMTPPGAIITTGRRKAPELDARMRAGRVIEAGSYRLTVYGQAQVIAKFGKYLQALRKGLPKLYPEFLKATQPRRIKVKTQIQFRIRRQGVNNDQYLLFGIHPKDKKLIVCEKSSFGRDKLTEFILVGDPSVPYLDVDRLNVVDRRSGKQDECLIDFISKTIIHWCSHDKVYPFLKMRVLFTPELVSMWFDSLEWGGAFDRHGNFAPVEDTDIILHITLEFIESTKGLIPPRSIISGVSKRSSSGNQHSWHSHWSEKRRESFGQLTDGDVGVFDGRTETIITGTDKGGLLLSAFKPKRQKKLAKIREELLSERAAGRISGGRVQEGMQKLFYQIGIHVEPIASKPGIPDSARPLPGASMPTREEADRDIETVGWDNPSLTIFGVTHTAVALAVEYLNTLGPEGQAMAKLLEEIAARGLIRAGPFTRFLCSPYQRGLAVNRDHPIHQEVVEVAASLAHDIAILLDPVRYKEHSVNETREKGLREWAANKQRIQAGSLAGRASDITQRVVGFRAINPDLHAAITYLQYNNPAIWPLVTQLLESAEFEIRYAQGIQSGANISRN
ncbi:MAG: hypothetical protein NTU54_01155, partial [Candidatus Omnitrophica bacterium]|nr:hypothetical protein [Candidatus Omnitrophota bacterium]